MPDMFQANLHKIIDLSKQILKSLDNELIQMNEKNNNSTEENNSKEDNNLVTLNTQRNTLIKLTLNNEQSEHYSNYLPLINEIVTLNQKLTTQAEANKLALKSSLLSLKKSQKASKTYKKY